ncbi:MAG: hypothetical protein OXI30_12855, partial [Chloroflexota bacterium]|nr:hypothetical protein [Chloroflexota bacterium]
MKYKNKTHDTQPVLVTNHQWSVWGKPHTKFQRLKLLVVQLFFCIGIITYLTSLYDNWKRLQLTSSL